MAGIDSQTLSDFCDEVAQEAAQRIATLGPLADKSQWALATMLGAAYAIHCTVNRAEFDSAECDDFETRAMALLHDLAQERVNEADSAGVVAHALLAVEFAAVVDAPGEPSIEVTANHGGNVARLVLPLGYVLHSVTQAMRAAVESCTLANYEPLSKSPKTLDLGVASCPECGRMVMARIVVETKAGERLGGLCFGCHAIILEL
jgi:hypothetical protein